jgi:hypothetical protein
MSLRLMKRAATSALLAGATTVIAACPLFAQSAQPTPAPAPAPGVQTQTPVIPVVVWTPPTGPEAPEWMRARWSTRCDGTEIV